VLGKRFYPQKLAITLPTSSCRSVGIVRSWTQTMEFSFSFREKIRENIKISNKESLGYFEFKKHKPWFNEGCSKLLDQRKDAKLQWLQDPNEVNGDNLNNIRCEASRHFRNKRIPERQN
jgi:hypothetical protein